MVKEIHFSLFPFGSFDFELFSVFINFDFCGVMFGFEESSGCFG